MVNHCQKISSLLLHAILTGSMLPCGCRYCIKIYRNRHSKEMIQHLENAGLGFYVKSTKTVHKLGNHSLQHLLLDIAIM